MTRRIRLVAAILRRARPPARDVVVLLLVLTLQAAPEIGMPLQMGRVLDGLTSRSFPQVVASVSAYTVLGFLTVASSVWFATASLKVVRSIQSSLGKMLFARMQRGPLSFLRDTSHGEVISRLTSDLDAVSNALTSILLPFARASVLFIAGAIVMFRLNWILALAALAFAPLWIMAIRPGADRLSDIRRDVMKRLDRINHVVSERLTYLGVARAKTYRAYENDLAAFSAAVDAVTEASLRLTRKNSMIMMQVNAVGLIGGQALLLIVGAWLAATGRSTPGEIVAFMGLQSRLFAPLNTLTNLHIQLASNEAVFDRVLGLLDADDEQSGDAPVGSTSLRLHIDRLERDGRVIIENIKADIEHRAWIGIAGRSGSGKTTLSLAMAALERLPGVHIWLGGVPIEELRIDALRQAVIVVPQHDTLFADTVMANLSYGLEPTDDDLRRALDIVELRDRFPSTPSLQEGVGELGSRLSGGERQRLAVARALLHRPAVLILDEALSGVDLEAERRIIDRIRHEAPCTLVSITHRLTTLKGCERVIMLDKRGESIEIEEPIT